MLSNMLTSSKLSMVLQTEYNFNKPFLKTGVAYETGSGFGEIGQHTRNKNSEDYAPCVTNGRFHTGDGQSIFKIRQN